MASNVRNAEYVENVELLGLCPFGENLHARTKLGEGVGNRKAGYAQANDGYSEVTPVIVPTL